MRREGLPDVRARNHSPWPARMECSLEPAPPPTQSRPSHDPRDNRVTLFNELSRLAVPGVPRWRQSIWNPHAAAIGRLRASRRLTAKSGGPTRLQGPRTRGACLHRGTISHRTSQAAGGADLTADPDRAAGGGWPNARQTRLPPAAPPGPVSARKSVAFRHQRDRASPAPPLSPARFPHVSTALHHFVPGGLRSALVVSARARWPRGRPGLARCRRPGRPPDSPRARGLRSNGFPDHR